MTDTDLSRWLDRQEAFSRAALAASVSPLGFRHERPEFGQSIAAAPGSVPASRHRARWDPEPDYCWHWLRDAAVIMRLAPVLARADAAGWQRRMGEYVGFSLRAATRPAPSVNPLRAAARPDVVRFLRPDAELAALSGDALVGEPRVNLDGSVDAERWSRPQHDGPALRALSCLGWRGEAPEGMAELLALDLGYTLRQAARPSVGPWEEEELDLHAFTLMAQRAALLEAQDSGWIADDAAEPALSRIGAALDALWDGRCLRARQQGLAGTSDAAVILGALLPEAGQDRFGPRDPRILATAAWLADWSERTFPVNGEGAPAIGRGPDDRYFGGNPWLPTTLAFAELHFVVARFWLDAPRLAAVSDGLTGRALSGDPAARAGDRAAGARCLIAAGERYLATVRRFAPADGRLPEQVDRATGAPLSCPDLNWSHAALIAALEARRRVLALLARG